MAMVCLQIYFLPKNKLNENNSGVFYHLETLLILFKLRVDKYGLMYQIIRLEKSKKKKTKNTVQIGGNEQSELFTIIS